MARGEVCAGDEAASVGAVFEVERVRLVLGLRPQISADTLCRCLQCAGDAAVLD
jgi:hypothetical protein